MLTAAQLREYLRLDFETGEFFRLRASGTAKVGDKAGSIDKGTGYRELSLLGKRYWAHRLVWLYVHGEWPSGDVDHINHCRSDNRPGNLRDVEHFRNLRNRRGAAAHSKSGILGVHWHKASRKWKAEIKVGEKNQYLGVFANLSDAVNVRKAAERRYFSC